jgi:hypothetical protein
MKLFSSFRSMTSAIFHRAQTEDALDEEMRAHVGQARLERVGHRVILELLAQTA